MTKNKNADWGSMCFGLAAALRIGRGYSLSTIKQVATFNASHAYPVPIRKYVFKQLPSPLAPRPAFDADTPCVKHLLHANAFPFSCSHLIAMKYTDKSLIN